MTSYSNSSPTNTFVDPYLFFLEPNKSSDSSDSGTEPCPRVVSSRNALDILKNLCGAPFRRNKVDGELSAMVLAYLERVLALISESKDDISKKLKIVGAQALESVPDLETVKAGVSSVVNTSLDLAKQEIVSIIQRLKIGEQVDEYKVLIMTFVEEKLLSVLTHENFKSIADQSLDFIMEGLCELVESVERVSRGAIRKCAIDLRNAIDDFIVITPRDTMRTDTHIMLLD